MNSQQIKDLYQNIHQFLVKNGKHVSLPLHLIELGQASGLVVKIINEAEAMGIQCKDFRIRTPHLGNESFGCEDCHAYSDFTCVSMNIAKNAQLYATRGEVFLRVENDKAGDPNDRADMNDESYLEELKTFPHFVDVKDAYGSYCATFRTTDWQGTIERMKRLEDKLKDEYTQKKEEKRKKREEVEVLKQKIEQLKNELK